MSIDTPRKYNQLMIPISFFSFEKENGATIDKDLARQVSELTLLRWASFDYVTGFLNNKLF